MLAHRRAVETRRLYRFEAVFTRQLPREVRRDRTIAELRDIAAEVWAQHGRNRAPRIVCVAGILENGERKSYALGASDIGLARNHRNLGGLLHELVHALGYGTHGRGFVNKYVDLLCAYGGCEEGHLRLGLALFKVEG